MHLSRRQLATPSAKNGLLILASSLRLKALAEDATFRDAVLKAQNDCKAHFAAWLKAASAITLDPQTMFDSQVKRIHEYKRQLLKALRIIVLYNRLSPRSGAESHALALRGSPSLRIIHNRRFPGSYAFCLRDSAVFKGIRS